MWPNELWIKLYLAREHLCLSHIVDFNWQWWLFKNTHDSTACLSFVIPRGRSYIFLSFLGRALCGQTSTSADREGEQHCTHFGWAPRRESHPTGPIQYNQGSANPSGEDEGALFWSPTSQSVLQRHLLQNPWEKGAKTHWCPQGKKVNVVEKHLFFLGLPEHKALFETKNREMLM